MLKPKQTHVIKFRDYDSLEESLKKYTYPDTKEVYVVNFKEENDDVSFEVWNINGHTGQEYITSFKVPFSNVKSVRDLETDSYLTSRTAG